MKPDGEYFRRVVPSPPPVEYVYFIFIFSRWCCSMCLFHTILPVADNFASNRDAYRILQVEAIRTLLEQCPEILPIACGGGGIPVSRIPSNPQTLQGVEAVIDKDRCGGKLANELDADGYIILTDGGGIWQNFGKPDAREMKLATPEYLLGKKAGKNFPGSMGPKIQAAIDFVQNSRKEGAWAAIGDLRDASKMFTNEEGTLIKKDVKVAEGVVWRENKITASKMKLTKDQSKYG
jgi:carbamate kinase